MPRKDRKKSPICAYAEHGVMMPFRAGPSIKSEIEDSSELTYSSHCLMMLAIRKSDNQLVVPADVVFSVDLYRCTKCGYIELYDH